MRVAARAQSLDLFRSIFEEFAAACNQADLGTLPGQREGNGLANAAAGSGYYGNLIL
jgi:hypothetical protein